MKIKILVVIYVILMAIVFVYQSYIVHYNYGNILFKNERYEEAIEEYEKALNKIVPKYKECKVRINYALALCKTVSLDESDENSVKNAIDTYQSASDILTEKGCASSDGRDFHNKDANTLREDIQNEIDRLKKLYNQEQNDNENDKKEEQQKNEEKNKEEKIKKIKEEAIIEQKKIEKQYEQYNKEFNKKDKNW